MHAPFDVAAPHQSGLGEAALLVQISNNNTATISQSGTFNAAAGFQGFGSGNNATVTQSAGNAATAFAQVGSNNTVSINQH